MAIEETSTNQSTSSDPKEPIKEEISNSENNGLIKIDTGKLQLPTQLIEEQEEKDTSFWQIEPAILVIFTLALAFIGFITMLISRMPAKQ